MKILVISHMYPSSINPTYGIFVHQQVQELKKQGCEVQVISTIPFAPWPLTCLKKKWRDYAAVPAKDTIDGVDVHYPRYLEFPRALMMEHSGYWMFRGMRRIVKQIYREFKFDLIHAHVAIPDGHAATLLRKEYTAAQHSDGKPINPKSRRMPVLITIHGQDFQSTIHKGKKCNRRLFQVLDEADKVITVSSKLKNIVKEQACFNKIIVINNGIEYNAQEQTETDADTQPRPHAQPDTQPPTFTHQTKIKNNPNEKQAKKIISVSNLKKTKGIDLNLQALAILVKAYPELHYTIVGDGEERENLENLVDRLNLRQHVEFLGKLPHAEALRHMENADIFSLPSWQEGFGMVYIEAMAQEVPVIGVQGEGIEDVITSGHNGILVKPQNVEEVARALGRLLEDEGYARQLAKAGKQTVKQTCTWQHNAEKTMHIYQTLYMGHKENRP